MAFSLRKMLSNIYFKRPEDEGTDNENSYDLGLSNRQAYGAGEPSNINFEYTEADSTCNKFTTSINLPESVKNFAAKKGSLSDTDVITVNVDRKQRRKKLKLNITKANQRSSDESSDNVENTPQHVHMQSRTCELFSERLKSFNFDKPLDFDVISDCSEVDIESLSDHSDTDVSLASDAEPTVKMCRKVDPCNNSSEEDVIRSATPESFGDVEVDKNEEERLSLLLRYQMKFEKVELLLKKLLSEFQFHVEVSKIFKCRSVVTTLPGTDVSKIPKTLGEVTYLDNLKRGERLLDSWNIVLEKEDGLAKNKVKKQLVYLRQSIDNFVNVYLKIDNDKTQHTTINRKSDASKANKARRHKRINNKKLKHFDFPDFREAMLNLFAIDDSGISETIEQSDTENTQKCQCQCHCYESAQDSDQNDHSLSSQSVTSSIGNFTLDLSTLSAYSESLDRLISYNSFQDSSLYNTMLQKPAIERITFYIQVHSIQVNCEVNEHDLDSKPKITFECPACKSSETDENDVLKHILSQSHCENIHFLYKRAYIKKCVTAGKEIQPSTVLNPMKLYRDDNKIVCFGDGVYACSLCFENAIVGESILMQHCADTEHVDRRNRFFDIE